MAERGIEGPELVGGIEDRTIDGPDRTSQTLRVYQPFEPAEAGPLPIIAYIHGGGWVIVDLDTYDASCRSLANRTGSVVVSIEYRHAPEDPFFAAHTDVLWAFRWLRQHDHGPRR